ncbi:hypothetical protein C7H19_24110 [Aphanothece hegewaldii CCALA 016]|uniref:DUF2997 domain-containing protein n=1 Tax=Aphanothece hegewaldii CCALA 016 TaxID=2107694 RepID=A0A2T1LR32_9CHRO|nr:DUF2997 domain-containing protein [Aphanothece hegewaldii]PSF30014.1 hypothetical protein C7H19_24110 [Aphanothece hegewaldii CCALA 016]
MEILLTVNRDGSSEIEVIGGDGKICLEKTKELEDALGVVENRELKPEYRQTVTQLHTQLRNRR